MILTKAAPAAPDARYGCPSYRSIIISIHARSPQDAGVPNPRGLLDRAGRPRGSPPRPRGPPRRAAALRRGTRGGHPHARALPGPAVTGADRRRVAPRVGGAVSPDAVRRGPADGHPR